MIKINKYELIVDLYFNKHKSIDFISKHESVKLSKPGVLKILKKDLDRYKKERKLRIKKSKEEKEEKYKKIQELFYTCKFTPSKIASLLEISKSMVTRAIKKLPEAYKKEKKRRLGSNINKHNDDVVIKALLKLQNQNAIQMSRKRKLSDEQIIAINLSHYKFNSNNNKYEFDETSGKRPFDLPKTF